jgi:hypothetical protein
LLADRDPEEARRLLDPVLERMMAAVHLNRSEVVGVRWLQVQAGWRPHED